MQKRENFPNKYSTKPRRSTSTLGRVTDILNCVAHEINTVTDIANHLQYSTSTVHRLLQTLSRLNWVVLDDNTHKYYLGAMVTQLWSNRIAAHKYLIMHSLREMEKLSRDTEETINLSVMVQMHYTLLHEITSLHNLSITEGSKKMGQQFNGATAKVLLSQLAPGELKMALKQIKVVPATDKTVTDKSLLMKQLEEIKQAGYCITSGERVPGAVCISVPVKRYICPVSLSVVGPETRLGPRAPDVIEELKASAERISSGINAAFSEKEVM